MNVYQLEHLERLIKRLLQTLHINGTNRCTYINTPNKAEMEYHENSEHNLGRMQHIALMSIIDILTQPFLWQPKL